MIPTCILPHKKLKILTQELLKMLRSFYYDFFTIQKFAESKSNNLLKKWQVEVINNSYDQYTPNTGSNFFFAENDHCGELRSDKSVCFLK